jgi:hypothetical protein
MGGCRDHSWCWWWRFGRSQTIRTEPLGLPNNICVILLDIDAFAVEPFFTFITANIEPENNSLSTEKTPISKNKSKEKRKSDKKEK